MRTLSILLLPLLFTGCRASVDVRPEAPPASAPAPAVEETAELPFLMYESDAIEAGQSFCAERRYRCVLRSAQLTGNRRWQVLFDASRGEAYGPLQLEFDSISWALRDVDDRVRGPGYASHYDEERPTDEERGDRPQKRGKGKAKAKRQKKHVQ